MDDSIKEQAVHAIQRLRRANLLLYFKNLDLTELILMKSLVANNPNSERNTYMSDLKKELCVSKGAISQIVSHMEQKGYLVREIDKSNRRKLIVTLTPEGRKVMAQADSEFNRILDVFLARLGEQDSLEVVRLFNRVSETAEELTQENMKP